MKPTPEQIEKRRAELLCILDIEEPWAKSPWDRKRRAWRERRDDAKAELARIDRGEWEVDAGDVPW